MTRQTRSSNRLNPDDQVAQRQDHGQSVQPDTKTQSTTTSVNTMPSPQPQLQFQPPTTFFYNQQQPFQSQPSVGGVSASTGAPTTSGRRKSTGGGGNRKGNPPERRAQHNAIERARREILNSRFEQLASILPATSDVKRPSKSMIVNKSLAFVEDALSREDTYRSQITDLESQNESLVAQLNKIRKDHGLAPIEPRPAIELPTPLSDVAAAKLRVASIANEAPDTGAAGAGDLDEDDGSAGEGGSIHHQSPQHQGKGLPAPPSDTGFHHQYGFAPAPVAHPSAAARFYDYQAAYFPQSPLQSPGLARSESQYSSPGAGQYSSSRPLQPYHQQQQAILHQHHQQQQQQHHLHHQQQQQQQQQQSQHFEPAMIYETGRETMASSIKNPMPPQYHYNENDSNCSSPASQENDSSYHLPNFNYQSNNFGSGSSFSNEVAHFGGINFGGFNGANVMLEI